MRTLHLVTAEGGICERASALSLENYNHRQNSIPIFKRRVVQTINTDLLSLVWPRLNLQTKNASTSIQCKKMILLSPPPSLFCHILHREYLSYFQQMRRLFTEPPLALLSPFFSLFPPVLVLPVALSHTSVWGRRWNGSSSSSSSPRRLQFIVINSRPKCNPNPVLITKWSISIAVESRQSDSRHRN